jgi:hypothetical protein
MTANDLLVEKATQNIQDILKYSIKFDSSVQSTLVIFDTQNELTQILTHAYRAALPEAKFLDFDTLDKQEIIAQFNALKPDDLVVLIQTGSFRLDDFRIRIHLFNLKLKVIEHLHLYRNSPQTWPIYINSLEYDQNWYGQIGPALRNKLSNCQSLGILTSNGSVDEASLNNDNKESGAHTISKLVVTGGLEIPKLNTGDYTGLNNVGGTFPIGEVFTEAKVLENLSGSFWVYAFANEKFEVILPEIFEVTIVHGLLESWSKNAPKEFIQVVENIKLQERAIVREIGFGLNRAMSKSLPLGDITAFERIVGVHLSLGEKHSVYSKEGITKHKARFHVDLFLQTKQVLADSEVIFEDGKYTLL